VQNRFPKTKSATLQSGRFSLFLAGAAAAVTAFQFARSARIHRLAENAAAAVKSTAILGFD